MFVVPASAGMFGDEVFRLKPGLRTGHAIENRSKSSRRPRVFRWAQEW